MSTRRNSLPFGLSKKISSWVRPGVCDVRARALRPVSALMRLDLPTLERPANATSMPAIGGNVSIEGDAQMNFHSPANIRRPCSISFASGSSVMRSLSFAWPCSFTPSCRLSAATHASALDGQNVDARDEPGHDEFGPDWVEPYVFFSAAGLRPNVDLMLSNSSTFTPLRFMM